jgi:hypothetical protein
VIRAAAAGVCSWRAGALIRAGLALGLVLAATPVPAHVVLDAESVQEILTRVARSHAASRTAGPEGAAALFALGEAVEALVERMNHDVRAHGRASLFAQALVRRLEAYGARVTQAGPARTYDYDLGAFEDYLRRAPAGPRAAEARFKLIARRFHGSIGSDPAQLADGDVAGLLRAVAAEERFLRDHPSHDRARQVRFFLAVDYYRAARNLPDPGQAREFAARARRELERVLAGPPGPAEERAAATLLEALDR